MVRYAEEARSLMDAVLPTGRTAGRATHREPGTFTTALLHPAASRLHARAFASWAACGGLVHGSSHRAQHDLGAPGHAGGAVPTPPPRTGGSSCLGHVAQERHVLKVACFASIAGAVMATPSPSQKLRRDRGKMRAVYYSV